MTLAHTALVGAVPVPQEAPLTVVCRTVLTPTTPLKELEAGLRCIFKASLEGGGSTAANFLLSRVQWFEEPYCQLLPILHKIIRWHRGCSRESATVCYNIVAEGMHGPNWQLAAESLATLAESDRDQSVLLASLRQSYPFKTRSVEVHEHYLLALLEFAKRQPELRQNVLAMVLEKLSSLDSEMRCADEQLLEPYPDEEVLTENREHQDDTASKLDRLLKVLLDYIEKEEEPEALVADLLPIFSRQLLLTDRLKSVQFVMFFACERTRTTSLQFLELLTANLRNASLCKYVFINNVYYYASYLVHSKRVSNGVAVRMMQLVMESIRKQLADKSPLDALGQVNLRQHFDDNQAFMHQLQLLVYVCTYRARVYNEIQQQLDDLLVAVRKVCLFQAFVHPEIWTRFIDTRGHLYQEQTGSQHQYLGFEGKFNMAPLPNFGRRIDKCYRFSDLAPLTRKRKASYALQGKPSKKVKLFEKHSQASDESTTFHRGGEYTPHREV